MDAPASPAPDGRETASSPRDGAFEPFRHSLFTACWFGSLLSHGAVWMQNIAVPYLVFELTGSATWLGIAAVAGQAPALVASPLGGVLADRYSRRGLLLATLAVKVAVALGFYSLWRIEALHLGAMMTLLGVNAVAHTVHLSCSSSFLPQLVPRRILAGAYRMNSIQVNLSRAAGPAVAGFVLAQHGAGAAFLTSVFAYIPFTVVLAFARPRPIVAAKHEGTLRALHAGLSAVRGSRSLGIPILTAGVVSFFGAGLQPLIAGLASEVYGVGAQGFGWLVSSMGIACAVSGVTLALIGERTRRSRSVRIGLVFYAAGAVLAGATDIYAVGLAAFAVIGVGHVFVYVSCATSMQLHLSEELRGRVTSLYMTAIFVAMPAGAQLGGLLGDRIGLPAVAIGYGLALATYAALSRVLVGGFRDLDGELAPDDPVPGRI